MLNAEVNKRGPVVGPAMTVVLRINNNGMLTREVSCSRSSQRMLRLRPGVSVSVNGSYLGKRSATFAQNGHPQKASRLMDAGGITYREEVFENMTDALRRLIFEFAVPEGTSFLFFKQFFEFDASFFNFLKPLIDVRRESVSESAVKEVETCIGRAKRNEDVAANLYYANTLLSYLRRQHLADPEVYINRQKRTLAYECQCEITNCVNFLWIIVNDPYRFRLDNPQRLYFIVKIFCEKIIFLRDNDKKDGLSYLMCCLLFLDSVEPFKGTIEALLYDAFQNGSNALIAELLSRFVGMSKHRFPLKFTGEIKNRYMLFFQKLCNLFFETKKSILGFTLLHHMPFIIKRHFQGIQWSAPSCVVMFEIASQSQSIDVRLKVADRISFFINSGILLDYSLLSRMVKVADTLSYDDNVHVRKRLASNISWIFNHHGIGIFNDLCAGLVGILQKLTEDPDPSIRLTIAKNIIWIDSHKNVNSFAQHQQIRTVINTLKHDYRKEVRKAINKYNLL